jgi:hypothetical protein
MASIDVALIPPGFLAAHYCEGRKYQMALATVLQADGAYRNYYRQGWRPRDSYYILDNGAWEEETLPPDELITVSRLCNANEIMTPDVINDPAATWAKTIQFLDYFDAAPGGDHTRPKFTAIAHGDSVSQALSFVQAISEEARISSIAIGRAYSRKVGNPTARLELALSIHERYGSRFQIHLLGFSDEWPTELQHCNSYPGLIRSVDTIAPFSYAYQGLSIDTVGKVSVPRPADYFDLAWDQFDHDLVEHNIRTLDRWARSTITGVR